MLTIIEIGAREDGGHGLQSQSHRTECWMEGWIAVPPQLEKTAWDCCGYCDLKIENGVLVGLTPGQVPEPEPAPEPEPTEAERLRADLDYLAVMTGVEL
ncbi:toxin-antitoxin system toxin subunit [Flavonifractor sp. An4]|uniref:toxin-antitoxin system toxin subunit n=1 Tax=Flavonifractor sp. An4 TaxID=1965634 RepID=UPI001FA8DCB6|nr:toxin-antitoxin system toxin subunit [Flavonifractor sp. An4]